MAKETAANIYNAFLSVKQDTALSSHFANCQFEYKVKNNAGAYSCEVPLTENQKYFFVISDAKEFRNEVNPVKINENGLIYIAYLNYNKDARKLIGEQLLFNPKDKTITDTQEVKRHF